MNGNVELVAVIGAGGIGDLLLSRQVGQAIHRGGDIGGDVVQYFYPVRFEVFRVMEHLFPGCYQIGEEFDNGNNYERDESYRVKFKQQYPWFDNVYYVVPDLLFMNDHAFDYRKYNVDIQTIKATRVLLNQRQPSKKLIYLGLATSTPNYHYPQLKDLLVNLAGRLPDHTLYFPYVKNWSGKDLDFGDLTGLPSNVWIHENPDFLESIEIMKEACYGICTCNGASHIMYHLGIPRLVLDPQFGKPAWISRWKEAENECIWRETDPDTVAHIVQWNIEVPQTTLIDRKYLLNKAVDWREMLMLKKY